MLRTLKSSSKLDLHRNGSLTPQLLTEKLEFQPQLTWMTSLYMVWKTYKFQFYPNCNNDHYISYGSKELASYVCWTANVQKIFTLQTNLLERSVFDLHTDDSIPNFQSAKKNVSIMRHTNIFGTTFLPTSQKLHLSKKEVQLSFSVHFHLFCNLKTASSIGSLRNYVPLKRYYFSRKIFFLLDLWPFRRKVLFLLIQHISIPTTFHPQLLSRIHICQKSSTTHWLIKLWNFLLLLLRNTNHIVKSSLRLRN